MDPLRSVERAARAVLKYATFEMPIEFRVATVLFVCYAIVFWLLHLQKPSLRGKIVLITGGGSGIGRATAVACAVAGATVIVWDIDEQAALATEEIAAEAVEMIDSAGGMAKVGAIPPRVDVSDPLSVAAAAVVVSDLIHEISIVKSEEEVGGDQLLVPRSVPMQPLVPDIIISCAGVVNGVSAHELTAEQVQRTLGVNVVAHFHLLRAFLPGMRTRGHGSIILVSSLMGMLGGASLTDYCASKWAVLGLGDSLRLELQRDGLGTHWLSGLVPSWLYRACAERRGGINVATVCPYATSSGMFNGIFGENHTEVGLSVVSEGTGTGSIAHSFSLPKLARALMFPTLTPSSVAASLLSAACSRVDGTITLPWYAWWAVAVPRLVLPSRLWDAYAGMNGGWYGMESFVGRKTGAQERCIVQEQAMARPSVKALRDALERSASGATGDKYSESDALLPGKGMRDGRRRAGSLSKAATPRPVRGAKSPRRHE